jgi:hypothetical protein
MFDLLSQSVVCTCPLSCVFHLPLIVLHVMGLVFLITSNSWDPTDDCGIDYSFCFLILLVNLWCSKNRTGGWADFVDLALSPCGVLLAQKAYYFPGVQSTPLSQKIKSNNYNLSSTLQLKKKSRIQSLI